MSDNHLNRQLVISVDESGHRAHEPRTGIEFDAVAATRMKEILNQFICLRRG